MSETPITDPAAPAAAEAVLAAEKTASAATPAAPALTGPQALDAWMQTYVRGTAISRDTAAYNQIFNAVQQIKAVLAAVKGD